MAGPLSTCRRARTAIRGRDIPSIVRGGSCRAARRGARATISLAERASWTAIPSKSARRVSNCSGSMRRRVARPARGRAGRTSAARRRRVPWLRLSPAARPTAIRRTSTASAGRLPSASPVVDLGAKLVLQGWAVAFRRYSTMYVPLEEQARQARHGVWAGKFQMPWDWRAEQRTR
jgi:hypothetical protein